jgi:hypothetical protein
MYNGNGNPTTVHRSQSPVVRIQGTEDVVLASGFWLLTWKRD